MGSRLCFIISMALFTTVVSFGVSKKEHTPTIIWWTELLFPHVEDTTTIVCGESKCVSTQKKKLAKIASEAAFVFYGTDFDPENLPLPRISSHIWALLHEESPMNNFVLSHSAGIRLFNYTSTFSRYSDYPLTTQSIPSLDYITLRKPVPIQEKNRLRSIGFAPIIYVQSHCNVASDRDRYVKELMKHIDIDSYGACLHNKDLPPKLNTTDMYEDSKFLNFISKYKFSLAFENAICDDYITEKLLRPLHVGSVPIYRGSPSIKDWAPSLDSIIIVDEFESPKALASFIKMLDKNDELYQSYLSYKEGIVNERLKQELSKRDWGVNDEEKLDFIKGFECFICDNLHKNRQLILKNHEIPSKIANKKHMNCHQPHPSLDVGILPPKDEWMREDWIESYWFGLDQANVIHDMIRNNESDSSNFFKYLAKHKYKS